MSRSSPSTAAVRSGVSADRTAERTGTESSAAAAVTDACTDDAVGENEHAAAGGYRVGGLGDGVRTGHGDDREGRGVRRQVLETRTDGALRNGGGAAGRALPGRQRGVDGGLRGGQCLGVVGPD